MTESGEADDDEGKDGLTRKDGVWKEVFVVRQGGFKGYRRSTKKIRDLGFASCLDREWRR